MPMRFRRTLPRLRSETHSRTFCIALGVKESVAEELFESKQSNVLHYLLYLVLVSGLFLKPRYGSRRLA